MTYVYPFPHTAGGTGSPRGGGSTSLGYMLPAHNDNVARWVVETAVRMAEAGVMNFDDAVAAVSNAYDNRMRAE